MLLVHILRDGVILVPPFPAPKISRLLHAGSVRSDDFFWHEGMSAWEQVSTRWEPDAGPAPGAPVTLPPFAPASIAPLSAPPVSDPPPEKRPWRERTSLLQEAKKRYYETLVPWSHQTATDRSPS